MFIEVPNTVDKTDILWSYKPFLQPLMKFSMFLDNLIQSLVILFFWKHFLMLNLNLFLQLRLFFFFFLSNLDMEKSYFWQLFKYLYIIIYWLNILPFKEVFFQSFLTDYVSRTWLWASFTSGLCLCHTFLQLMPENTLQVSSS